MKKKYLALYTQTKTGKKFEPKEFTATDDDDAIKKGKLMAGSGQLFLIVRPKIESDKPVGDYDIDDLAIIYYCVLGKVEPGRLTFDKQKFMDDYIKYGNDILVGTKHIL